MSFKDFAKKAHDAFVSDDGEESKPKVTPTSAIKIPTVAPSTGFDFSRLSPSGASAAPAASPFTVPNTTVLDEAVYQRVSDKTNFDTTAVGKTVHKYYDALEGVISDTTQRFKAAIGQAQKLDGITPDQILGTFDSLKAALQTENDKFARAVDGQTQKEIVGRQQQLQQISDNITKLQQQIADFQAQHTQVTAELTDAQNKIVNAQQQMQLATSRRASEIDTQRAQFVGLLR